MPKTSGSQEIRVRGVLIALAVLVIVTVLSDTVKAFSGTALGLSSRATARHLSRDYHRSRRTQRSAISPRVQSQSGFGGRRDRPISLWFGGPGASRREFAFGEVPLVGRRDYYDRGVAGRPRSSCILAANNAGGIAPSSGEGGSTRTTGTGDGAGDLVDDYLEDDDDDGEGGHVIAGAGDLGDDYGEDDDDDGEPGEVIVVREEDMMEEWIERGFEPATFEPQLLMEIWEAEEEDLEDDDEGEQASMIDAVMEEAAVEAARSRSLKLSQRDQRSPRMTSKRNMDDVFDDNFEEDEADIEAVMAAAAEESERDRRTRGYEGGRDVRTAPEQAVPAVEEEEDEEFAGSGGDSLGGRAVGIDLGTTNSAVAIIVDGQPVMVKNAQGKFMTPSVVSYASESNKRNERHVASNGQNSGEDEQNADDLQSAVPLGGGVTLGVGETSPGVFVGAAAVERLAIDPRSTYSSVKRVMGRTVKEAREAGVGLGALNVDQGQPLVRLTCPAKGEGNTVSPEEVSAEILRALLRDAEEFIGGDAKVKRAVVAVPAYFTPAQCEATQLAGRMAGLEKVKLMREPEAAALAYGLDKGGDELILVFDLGGGTFDVSVLEVGGGIAEVIATSGDNQLGGDDFDQAIAGWLFGQVVSLGGKDLRNDPVATRRMIEAARAARERLTTWTETEILLPLGEARTGSTKLTRKQMETVVSEPLKRVMQPLREVAIMADISLPGDTGAFMDYDAEDPREEREGGNSNLRKLRNQQSKARKKSKDLAKRSRTQAHSMAEISRKMEGGGKLRSFPQGRSVDQVVLVGGATRMPCVQNLVAGITGVKPKRTVDPDRAVALGAAVYAGILEGEVEGQEVMTAWQASVYRMMATSGMME